jgi:hypothetical protein
VHVWSFSKPAKVMHTINASRHPWVVPRFLGFVVRRSCVVSHELCCRGYWKVATTAKVVQKVRGVSFCCDGRGEMCFSRATPSRLHLCCHKQLNCCFRLSMCLGSLFSVCFPSLFLNLGFACLILKVVRVRQGETQLKWTNVWGWLFDLLRLNVCFHVTACPRSQVQLS